MLSLLFRWFHNSAQLSLAATSFFLAQTHTSRTCNGVSGCLRELTVLLAATTGRGVRLYKPLFSFQNLAFQCPANLVFSQNLGVPNRVALNAFEIGARTQPQHNLNTTLRNIEVKDYATQDFRSVRYGFGSI